MNAGRELDRLVAEKVMKYTICAGENIKFQGPFGAERFWVELYSGPEWLKPYSTDLKCAWELIEKLQSSNNLNCRIINDRNTVMVSFFDTNEWDAETAVTAPHAICLAALKAVGYENS